MSGGYLNYGSGCVEVGGDFVAGFKQLSVYLAATFPFSSLAAPNIVGSQHDYHYFLLFQSVIVFATVYEVKEFVRCVDAAHYCPVTFFCVQVWAYVLSVGVGNQHLLCFVWFWSEEVFVAGGWFWFLFIHVFPQQVVVYLFRFVKEGLEIFCHFSGFF